MSGYTDIRPMEWLRVRAPKWHAVWLLGRFDRPVGTWLLFLPCVFGLSMTYDWSRGALNYLIWIVLFGFGSLFMRAAGCAVNDLLDRNLDKMVERTAARPLASGLISPKEGALILAGFLAVGFLVFWQLPVFAKIIALASLPMVGVYPLMKRITWWPQAFLGLTFNWGILVAGALTQNTLSVPVILMYVGSVFWTLFYDTIYAHQDRVDDALVGIKSSARFLGTRTVPILAVFLIILIMCFAAAMGLAGYSVFALALLALPFGHGVWQLRALDINAPERCLTLFKSNRDLGLLLVLALIIGRFL